MTTVQNVYKRGWVDTRNNVQEILKADTFLGQLITRHAEITTIKNDTVSNISGATQILCGARYLAHGLQPKNPEYIKSLVIGELMSPMLPTNLCLQRDRANAEFVFICMYLLKNDTVYNRNKTGVQWVEYINNANQQLDPANRVVVPSLDHPTIPDLQNYLLWLVYTMPKSQYMSALQLLITTYVGAAKRGTVSDKFIEKIQTGIKDDLGENITLDIGVIHSTYVNFGRYINADNAKTVFDTWLTDVPEHALRLRLTLEQVSGSGLTAFLTIGKAIMKYKDFPWHKLDRLTDGEMTNYLGAIRVVNGNPYYGFNRDLKAAKSTNYSSIAYVAKELLIRIAGELSLKNYQGWIKKPKSPLIIDQMIDNYVNKHNNLLATLLTDDSETEDLLDILNIIGSPSNVNLFV